MGLKRYSHIKVKEGREVVFLENIGYPSGSFKDKVRSYCNAFLNSHGGVLYFGCSSKGCIYGECITRKSEDDYRLAFDSVLRSFVPFVSVDKYRLSFLFIDNEKDLGIIEIKVSIGDLGEIYEDGFFNVFIIDCGNLVGPLYPQELKELILLKYKESVEGAEEAKKFFTPNIIQAREQAKLTAQKLAFIFAWIYIRLFQHQQLSEVSSTLTSIFGLFITLMTSALVPVDVFLVSYMKNANGTFKNWASDNITRNSIEDTVTYCYYALYGLVALFVFLILPLMYFYYEEKDDAEVTTKQRCCTAFKYSLVFLLAAFVILLTGALVPLKKLPSNMTTFDEKFDFLKLQLESYDNVKQCMIILVGVLSMFGMLLLIQYVAIGMSALPLGMIQCGKNYREEPESKRKLTRKEKDQEKATMLRAKTRAGRNLTRFERNEMRRIEQDELLQHRINRKKNAMKNSACGKFLSLLKPFQVVFGVLFLFISLLIMVSLTITSIDKALHSLGPKAGYALPEPIFPNPINIVMVYAQQVFPLDYILFTGIILFFVFACMNGIMRVGIWCCCIKMFKIRPGRTMPQALLFMVFIMMLIIISLNIILLTASPQYMQYGNQKYILNMQNSTRGNSSHHNETGFSLHPDTPHPISCSTKAPEGECVMSRLALIMNTLFYKAWFFGAFYFWSIWLFIGIYYIGLLYNIVAMCRKKSIEEILSSDEDSDEDMHTLITA